MTGKITNLILPGMLLGVLLGGILGYVLPAQMLAIGFIGELFVNALRIIAVPLVVAGAIVGIASLGSGRQIGRLGLKTLGYFLATSVVAVVLGIILALLVRPGDGAGAAAERLPASLPAGSVQTVGDFFMTLIPNSLLRAVAEGQVLGLLVIALFFGGILATVGQRGRIVVDFFRGLYDVTLKLVQLILYAAPIGLLSIMGSIVALHQDSLFDLFHGLAMYAVTLIVGLLVFAVAVLPFVLKRLAKRSPRQYWAGMTPAFLAAFGTSSTSAALPVTYECVVNKHGVDERAGSLVLPLGASLNMGATAMYLAVASIFVAQAFGVPLSATRVMMIGVAGVLLSVGVSGLPSAAFLMLAAVFGAADFPPHAYAGLGLVLAADWLVDRCRAVVNIWGDAVGAAVIAETEELRQRRRMPAEASGAGLHRRTQSGRVETYAGAPRGDRGERRSEERHAGRPQSQHDRAPERSYRGARSGGGFRQERFPERTREPLKSSPFAVSGQSAETFDAEAVGRSRPAPGTDSTIRPEERDRGRGRTESHRRSEARPRPQRSRGEAQRIRPEGKPDERVERALARLSGETREQQEQGRITQPVREEPRSGPAEVEAGVTTDSVWKIGPGSPENGAASDGTDRTDLTRASAEHRPEAVSAGNDDESTSESHSSSASDETASVRYGRSRFRRQERQPTETPAPEPEQPPAEQVEEGFSSDGIEFGRSKRKRFK